MSTMDGLTTGLDLELGAMHVGDWYAREEGKWPLSYGKAVSHEMARMMVHDGLDLAGPVDATDIFDLRADAVKDDGVSGWSVSVSDLDQINQSAEPIGRRVHEARSDSTNGRTQGDSTRITRRAPPARYLYRAQQRSGMSSNGSHGRASSRVEL